MSCPAGIPWGDLDVQCLPSSPSAPHCDCLFYVHLQYMAQLRRLIELQEAALKGGTAGTWESK
jgi:hypothetical protein